MPRYSYIALAGDGSEIRGVLEGPDPAWIGERLVKDELLPLEVKPAGQGPDLAGVLRQLLPVTIGDIAVFSHHFAMVIEAGLPLLTGLELLAENAPKQRLGDSLREAAQVIREGGTLRDGLKASGIYPRTYLSMLGAAEESGRLAEVLARLSLYLEREATLRSRLRNALVYPALLVVLSVIVVTFLMVFIIPRFTEILIDLGVDLPLPTRVLIAVHGFVAGHWPWIVGVGLLLPATGAYLIQRPHFRRGLDELVLRLPLAGDVVLKSSVARLSYVLSNLLTSGVSLVHALEVAEESPGNMRLTEVVAAARDGLSRGQTVTEALSGGNIFPPLMIQMVALGESTGKLDQVLAKLAEIYDDQVERTLQLLVGLVEPSLIVFLGVVIGFIALSLVLPMVKSVTALGG